MAVRGLCLFLTMAVFASLQAGCGGGGGGNDGPSGPAPSLASVTPSTIEGMFGTNLTLTGQNLGSSGDAARVRLRATSGTPFENGTAASIEFDARVRSPTEVGSTVPMACMGSRIVADLVYVRGDGATSTLRSALQFEPQAKVTDPDGDSSSALGSSVAQFLHWTVSGEPRAPVDGLESGAAYFHDAETGLTQRVVPLDGSTGARFGCAVAMDYDLAVIGAEGAGGVGAAYVFMRLGAGSSPWVQVQKLTASDGWLGDRFGRAVAVEGDVLAVGAPLADRGTSDNAGAVYVFQYNGMAWSQRRKLGASDRNDGDEFGSSLAVTMSQVFVGAPKANTDLIVYVDAGAVYVFDRSNDIWPATESAKLEAAWPDSGDHFGEDLGWGEDWLLVGAPGDDDRGVDAGAVHAFHESGTGWSDMGKLLAPGGAAGDGFGTAVAVASSYAVIGAPGDDDGGQNAGSASVLNRVQMTWSFRTTLRAASPSAGDAFGAAVSYFWTPTVGAPGDDEVAGGAGAYYIH